MVDKNQQIIDSALDQEYKYGFTTDIEQTTFEPGLNEDVITRLSKLKKEPQWLLDWRLKAYKSWQKMEEPTWAQVDYNPVDYQSLSYYAAPKYKKNDSLDDVDPDIIETYNKLGISLNEQKRLEGVAVDGADYRGGFETVGRRQIHREGELGAEIRRWVRNEAR